MRTDGTIKIYEHCVYSYKEAGKGKLKFTSHLIYYYKTGKFPEKDIKCDHLNQDTFNEKWVNLEFGSNSRNLANQSQRRDSDYFYQGYNLNSKSSYRAHIGYNGIKINFPSQSIKLYGDRLAQLRAATYYWCAKELLFHKHGPHEIIPTEHFTWYETMLIFQHTERILEQKNLVGTLN